MSTHIEPRTGTETTVFLSGMAALLVVGVLIGLMLAGWWAPLNAQPLPMPQPMPLPTAFVQPDAR